MPLAEPRPAPKLHCSPFVWSHGRVLLQYSKSCRAQTLQHPQLSGTRLTPAAHLGTSAGHRQCSGHEADTWDTTPSNSSNSTSASTINHEKLSFPHQCAEEDLEDKRFPHVQRLKWTFPSVIHPTWQRTESFGSRRLLLYAQVWRVHVQERRPSTTRGMLLCASSRLLCSR